MADRMQINLSSPRFSHDMFTRIEPIMPTYEKYRGQNPPLTLQDKFTKLASQQKVSIKTYITKTPPAVLHTLLKNNDLDKVEEYADVLFEHFTFLAYEGGRSLKIFTEKTKLDENRAKKLYEIIWRKLDDKTFPLGTSPKNKLEAAFFKEQEVEELLQALPHTQGFIKQSISNLLNMRDYIEPMLHHTLVAQAIGVPTLNYFRLVDFIIDKHELRQSLPHKDQSSYDYKKYIIKPFERIQETKVFKE